MYLISLNVYHILTKKRERKEIESPKLYILYDHIRYICTEMTGSKFAKMLAFLTEC